MELTHFEIDELQPAMVWEVTDPTFVVGSLVSVFLGRADANPQPGDLPAIVLAEPDLIPKIGFDSMSVREATGLGAEIRGNIELPPDGQLVLANTLEHLMTLYNSDQQLFDDFVATP